MTDQRQAHVGYIRTPCKMEGLEGISHWYQVLLFPLPHPNCKLPSQYSTKHRPLFQRMCRPPFILKLLPQILQTCTSATTTIRCVALAECLRVAVVHSPAAPGACPRLRRNAVTRRMQTRHISSLQSRSRPWLRLSFHGPCQASASPATAPPETSTSITE